MSTSVNKCQQVSTSDGHVLSNSASRTNVGYITNNDTHRCATISDRLLDTATRLTDLPKKFSVQTNLAKGKGAET